MKHFTLARLVAVVFATLPTLGTGTNCTEEYETCIIRVPHMYRDVQYDKCLQICCGGNLLDKESVYSGCCGLETYGYGAMYNTQTQICCDSGGRVEIYDRTNATDRCCGAELFNREMHPTHTCCEGSPGQRPQIINNRTEMCCQGRAQFAGDTTYAQCCGKTSYDRRVASCPCQNDVVYVGVPMNGFEDCCYSNDRSIRNAYNRNTQGCCAGELYEIATEFCCNGSIGIIGNQTCCENSRLTPLNAEAIESDVGCCEMSDESNAVYNTLTQACCGNRIQNLNTSISQICCDGDLFDREVFGSVCCGSTPYFPELNVCCSGVVAIGDRCCDGVPFSTEDRLVCCQGEIEDGTACCGGIGFDPAFDCLICCQGDLRNASNFVIPSCCSFESFDSLTQTCCGSTIYNNPLVPYGQKGFVYVSHTTKCCGDDANPESLRPYDYYHERCCSGVINDLGVTPYELSACCGDSVVDRRDELCCNETVVRNPYGLRGECCGDTVINSDTQICCGDVPSGPRNSSDLFCCGDNFANRDTEICCDGNPIRFSNIPVESSAEGSGDFVLDATSAGCCGVAVFDERSEICCGGVINQRRSSNVMCCGVAVFDERSEMCCEGVINQRRSSNAKCCGVSVFYPGSYKCCDGEIRPLNEISPESAICCGNRCIDGDTYWCCNGRQYSRGSITGEDIEDLTCSDVFPE